MSKSAIRLILGTVALSASLLPCAQLLALQDAAVLPAGARRVALTGVSTTMSAATDSRGRRQSLATPLHRSLPFAQLVAKSQGFDRVQLGALLSSAGISSEMSAGQFTADLRAQINVVGPTFAYGLTDRLTVGFGVPIYSAHTSARLGFAPNERAEQLVQALVDQGLAARAREAAMQLNAAAEGLQATLMANGYERVGDWSATGLGDFEVQAKYQHYNTGKHRLASLSGVVVPTGRLSDPNILTDVPFGDGNWDVFTSVITDQFVTPSWLFSQYARYTHQLPARKEVRMITEQEAIAVDTKKVKYKLGDKFDAGVSSQLRLLSGFSGGIGYDFSRKFSDRYSAGPSSGVLGADTDQQAHMVVGSLGYSSLRQFMQQQASIPFETILSYQQQVASQNQPVRDMVQFDVKVFF